MPERLFTADPLDGKRAFSAATNDERGAYCTSIGFASPPH